MRSRYFTLLVGAALGLAGGQPLYAQGPKEQAPAQPQRKEALAAKLGLTYTRYADDLTLSGDDPLEQRIGYVMARVRHIAQEEGFAINEAKSRVLRRNTAQVVTGLVVNDRPGVRRAEVRRLRAILHRGRSEGLERQNRSGRPNFEAWLRGKIAFVAMARPDVGRALMTELDRIRTARTD